MVSATKDPNKVRAGQIGARSRWGPPRIIRLDTLPPAHRQALLAYLAVARTEEAAPDVETGAAMSTEGTADAASTV